MARKAIVYRVAIHTLIKLGYVRETIDNITGEVKRYPCGMLEDVVIGVARQCDKVGEFDVKPSLLRRLAMIDGLTADVIARCYNMDKRQAQRYMRKLLTIQGYIEQRLPWACLASVGPLLL